MRKASKYLEKRIREIVFGTTDYTFLVTVVRKSEYQWIALELLIIKQNVKIIQFHLLKL